MAAPATASGAGECGHRFSIQQQGDQATAAGGERGLRQVAHDADDVAEEALLGDMQAKELRNLVENDH